MTSLLLSRWKAWRRGLLTAQGRLLRTCMHCHKEWEAAIDTLCSLCWILKAESIKLKHRRPVILSSVCAWSQCGWACVYSVCILRVIACSRPNVIGLCVCNKRSRTCNLMTQPPMCVNAASPVFQNMHTFHEGWMYTVIHTSSLVPWSTVHCCRVHFHVPSQTTGFQLFQNLKSKIKMFSEFPHWLSTTMLTCWCRQV